MAIPARGYPEPLLKKIDRRDYLHTLIQSILYKDIVRRFRLRSVQGMDDLALYLMSNIAREARTETITWQNAERQIRLVPLWQWLLENS